MENERGHDFGKGINDFGRFPRLAGWLSAGGCTLHVVVDTAQTVSRQHGFLSCSILSANGFLRCLAFCGVSFGVLSWAWTARRHVTSWSLFLSAHFVLLFLSGPVVVSVRSISCLPELSVVVGGTPFVIAAVDYSFRFFVACIPRSGVWLLWLEATSMFVG